jgi:NADPH:quinone reductase
LKRVAVHALDGIAALEHEDCPVPDPGPGEVRLKVGAVGLGFVDGLLIAGMYQWKPPLPYVPGGEIAGVVDAIGPHEARWKIGQPVATWQMGGGLSEYCLVPSDALVPVPAGLPLDLAAASLLDYTTADYALNGRARLNQGELVLVLGANGGIGNAAIQIARQAGAVVIAGVSSDARREPAIRRGASMTVDLSSPEWRQELRTVTRSRAPDVVVDPLGGIFTEPAFRSLAKRGRHLVIGFAAQGISSLPVNLALLKNADLMGIDIRDVVENDGRLFTSRLEKILRDLSAGVIAPPLVCRYALSEAQIAFQSLRERNRYGKTLIYLNSFCSR